MLVAYCTYCLPTKVVLGYSNRVSDIKAPHQGHPYTKKNGYFPLSTKDWATVFVDGNDAQTKANIVAQFGDRIK